MELSLNDFVKKCNKCNSIILLDCPMEQNKKEDDKTVQRLARDFIKLNNGIENQVQEDNKAFYQYLKKLENKYEYKFKDGTTANINVFDPFAERNKLNEKWHIIISVLALREWINSLSDDDKKKYKWSYKKKGNIESIIIEPRSSGEGMQVKLKIKDDETKKASCDKPLYEKEMMRQIKEIVW